MEFAKKQLEKYGWTEGEGLGKDGNGRAHPVRVKIKRDYGGVGLQPGEEVVGQWWNKMFDAAARNITVSADKGDVVVQHRPHPGEAPLEAVNRRYRHSPIYSDFVKSIATDASGQPSSPDVPPSPRQPDLTMVSDVELWKACSGRTAHKAARHGMKLSGKLRRIEEQDTQHGVVKDTLHGVVKDTLHHVTKEVPCHVTNDTLHHVAKDNNHVTKEALCYVTEEVKDSLHHVITGTLNCALTMEANDGAHCEESSHMLHHVTKDMLHHEAKRYQEDVVSGKSKKAKRHRGWIKK